MPVRKSEIILTMLSMNKIAIPTKKPISLWFHFAGKASSVEAKRAMASIASQPRLTLREKEEEKSKLPEAWVPIPKRFMIKPDTRV